MTQPMTMLDALHHKLRCVLGGRAARLSMIALVLSWAAGAGARDLDYDEQVFADESETPFDVRAYVETNYQWNFGNPSNGITHLRGFDNRHNTFTLSNLAVGGSWDTHGAFGHVMLQVGHTPSTYYLAEPTLGGASGTNATSAEVFKYVQEAYAGYRIGAVDGLVVAAGIFLSPIGIEALPIHANDHWSRSNLFFGLPFYHTGVKLTYLLSDVISGSLAVYNGWNSVVDDNAAKSLAAELKITPLDALALAVVYFSGIERENGAPEGNAWRHLFNVQAIVDAHARLRLMVDLNGGFEPNRFGTSGWIASALYARVTILEPLRFAMRFDVFREYVAENAMGDRADAIFWPTRRVASLTSTFDYRPHPSVSFRLEHRYDGAASDVFFAGQVMGDGTTATPYLPNARRQNTLTLGATAWY
jgi:hypothetical protein